MRFPYSVLKERFVARGSNFIHNNPDVFRVLNRVSPDVVVTTGFNPTFLYAIGYAAFKGIPHVPMTDGTDVSEKNLSRWHKALRRLVYRRARAFIAASNGGMRLYATYGVQAGDCFLSCLCADNESFSANRTSVEKQHDLLFCGRMVSEKNPLFALQAAAAIARRLQHKVSILFVGTGEQESEVRAMAGTLSALVDARFHGHADQHALPALYQSARIFLFPTSRDVWGVVANEACAAGLPVIVSPHAGVAGELVLHDENGFVLPLDADLWAEHAARMLRDDALYQRFSARAVAHASRYTFDHAAAGIVDACRHAFHACMASRAGKPRPPHTP